MGADQFTVENGIAAQALTTTTTAPLAAEAWIDGAAPVYSAADGKLHPVVVQPVAGAIVSVTGITPIAVSPGVAPMVSLGVVPLALGGTGSATGDASSLINLPAEQLMGDAPLAAIATALATGGDPIKATVLTATTRVDSPTIGTSSAAQHVLPSGTADLIAADNARLPPTPTTVGKIPYDTGTGYSETATGGSSTTVLHGGATPAYAVVSLTADVSGTLPIGNLPTGTSSSTVAIGNDSRFNPVPSGAGKMLYDNASAYVSLAAGTTSQVLIGGPTPAFGSVPSAALPNIGTANTYAFPSSLTTDAQGRLTSVTAGTAPTSTGGAVALATAVTWGTNTYMGLAGTPNVTATLVTPWVAPCDGVMKNLAVQSAVNFGSGSTITAYKSATGSPSYSSTSITTTIGIFQYAGFDNTHTVSLTKGDMILFFNDTVWAGGVCASFQFVPTA